MDIGFETNSLQRFSSRVHPEFLMGGSFDFISYIMIPSRSEFVLSFGPFFCISDLKQGG